MKLFQDAGLLMRFAILQNSLNYSAAVRVNRECVYLPLEGFDDESDVLGWDALDGLLDNMVAILVLDALENIRSKFLGKLGLLIGKDMFQSLFRISKRIRSADCGDIPFERLCIRTFVWIAPGHGSSSVRQEPASGPGYHNQITSV
jgi:hypothetical protein